MKNNNQIHESSTFSRDVQRQQSQLERAQDRFELAGVSHRICKIKRLANRAKRFAKRDRTES